MFDDEEWIGLEGEGTSDFELYDVWEEGVEAFMKENEDASIVILEVGCGDARREDGERNRSWRHHERHHGGGNEGTGQSGVARVAHPRQHEEVEVLGLPQGVVGREVLHRQGLDRLFRGALR